MTTHYRDSLPAPYDRGTYPISVSTAQAAAGTVLHVGKMRLMGWSLASTQAVSLENTGEVTSPAAGATITSILNVPPGDYVMELTVDLAGTVGAPEEDNFQVFVGATLVYTSANDPVAGTYPQPNVVITVPVTSTVAVKAGVLGTVASQYIATIVLTGLAAGALGQLFDGAQSLGLVSTGSDQLDTEWFGGDGIYVGTSIAVKASAGNLSGVIYICDEPVGLAEVEPSQLSSASHRR